MQGPSNFHWTPLMFAVANGYFEICQLLLDHGALVDIPDVHMTVKYTAISSYI